MFIMRMVFRSMSRQLHKRVLIAVTVCLCACVSAAMLSVVFDVGDKLNAELSSYGSNIVVQPKSAAIVSDLYATTNTSSTQANDDNTQLSPSEGVDSLKEDDAAKIKTIFWAFNITNFAPTLQIQSHARVDGTPVKQPVKLIGTWFNRKLALASGETTVVGVRGMRSWWKVEGKWANDRPQGDAYEAMVGSQLAQTMQLRIGKTLQLHRGTHRANIRIVGVYHAGDEDDTAIYVPTIVAQTLMNRPQHVDRIEVKALTTPENDLARKAAKNPAILTQEEWETWYCTAYPSSITYQIEEVLPGAVAKQVRQVAALQGNVLNKTRAVMMVMTVLSLIAAAVAVANLMASSISERSGELALLKAFGARDAAVARLMLLETSIIAAIGAVVGMALGFGAAQIIGYTVFGSSIAFRPMVFVLVTVLLSLTVCIASLSSIRSIVRVRPAEVLHGR